MNKLFISIFLFAVVAQLPSAAAQDSFVFKPQVIVNLDDPMNPSVWTRWVDNTGGWSCRLIDIVGLYQSHHKKWTDIDDIATRLTPQTRSADGSYDCGSELPDAIIPNTDVDPTSKWDSRKIGLVRLKQFFVSGDPTASAALDFNQKTTWSNTDMVPELITRLDKPYMLLAVGYTPKPGGDPVGRLKYSDVFTSMDGEVWLRASKTYSTDKTDDERVIKIAPVIAKYIKWVALEDHSGAGGITAVELTTYGLDHRRSARTAGTNTVIVVNGTTQEVDAVFDEAGVWLRAIDLGELGPSNPTIAMSTWVVAKNLLANTRPMYNLSKTKVIGRVPVGVECDPEQVQRNGSSSWHLVTYADVQGLAVCELSPMIQANRRV